MTTVFHIVRKEFLQIVRNRAMLPILVFMPLVQMLVLAFAVTFEIKHTALSVHDRDHSALSRQLVRQFVASGHFHVSADRTSDREAEQDLLEGRARMILSIPSNFERDFKRTGAGRVQLIINAEDGAAAGVVYAYAQRVLAGFGDGVAIDVVGGTPVFGAARGIDVRPAFWYNPELNYQHYMVPGILVLLVTMIGTFLSAMNVVREKEIGTIEQLNVTPIRKSEFIAGKLIPFWILGLAELAVGLVLAWIIFQIPMRGSLVLLFFLAGVYLLVMLGFGLWISTITETQQQAMFIAWFFMVIFLLMSGLFTPIESMPAWAQRLTLLNPIAYFMEIMRRVLIKGAGFGAVQTQFWALVLYAAVMLTFAVRQYRKVSS